MTRILIILFIAYLLYRLIRAFFRPGQGIQGKPDSGVIDEMVQDPYCKTYIPRREAIKKVVAGEPHYFCSETCAGKFELERRT